MLGAPPPLQSLNAEHGFTMMEMLVAMVTGLVLATASFALLQLVTQQASRANDFVQASQLGRVAMTHVVDEMSSGCLDENATPVQSESSSEQVVFIAAYTKKTEIEPSEVQEHRIFWTKLKGEVGGLYEQKKIATKKASGSETEWEFPATAWGSLSKVLIDRDIARVKNAKTGLYEVFKYYKYGETAESSSTSGLSALKPIELKEGQQLNGEAAHVASAEILFRSLPTDESEKVGRDVNLNSQVTFAFSAGFTEPKVTSSGACQNQ